MANIKFSQFTVGNTESDIDFVVGYKGANNIQISPANLLSATLAGYLPLTGGTMSGNVKFSDNVELRLGSGADLKAYHSGTHTYFDNNVGDLIFRNFANDKDIVFQSDNGSGGLMTYFSLDGSDTRINVNASNGMQFMDNVRAKFGTSGDLNIYHDGSTSRIQNITGDIRIINFADDKDIIFQCDDGAGGVATYFYLDGSLTTVTPRTVFPDDSVLGFGTGADLQIYHDGTTSNIANYTNNLSIINHFNDGDIKFFSDDGSGGVTEYFRLDGGTVQTLFSKEVRFLDNVSAQFGSGGELRLYHTGTGSVIQNSTGNLTIQQDQNDGDIIFRNDDGSGGTTIYFFLDGSSATTQFYKTIKLYDSAFLYIGDNNDLQFYHNGTNSTIANYTGNLFIANNTDDADISFQCDNGSGSLAEYFRLDGSSVQTIAEKDFRFIDDVKVILGTGSDLQIYHNSTSGNGIIENNTGNLVIQNNLDDSDVIFKSDNGAGSVTAYITLDGSNVRTRIDREMRFMDTIPAKFGTSGDLQISHDATNTRIENFTGALKIINNTNDGDIEFYSDDGSGGITEYFRLDGSIAGGGFLYTRFPDNSIIAFGTGSDLQIYHSGSNSIIKDGGTGHLNIQGTNIQLLNSVGNKYYATFADGAQVKLFYNGVEKLETTSTGIKISGVSEYADNTAAIAGGLTTGDVYRTGDLLKIVH